MGNAIDNKSLNKEILLEIMTDNLPALRAMIGLSQDDISDIIGISRQTSRWPRHEPPLSPPRATFPSTSSGFPPT